MQPIWLISRRSRFLSPLHLQLYATFNNTMQLGQICLVTVVNMMLVGPVVTELFKAHLMILGCNLHLQQQAVSS